MLAMYLGLNISLVMLNISGNKLFMREIGRIKKNLSHLISVYKKHVSNITILLDLVKELKDLVCIY